MTTPLLVSRLVKYTGYGRAAGLLMSRGLLGGGTSPGQSNYSSDEEDSDTEEYMQSKYLKQQTINSTVCYL